MDREKFHNKLAWITGLLTALLCMVAVIVAPSNEIHLWGKLLIMATISLVFTIVHSRIASNCRRY